MNPALPPFGASRARQPVRLVSLLAAVVTIVLLAAACGGDDSSGASTGDAGSAIGSSPEATTDAGDTSTSQPPAGTGGTGATGPSGGLPSAGALESLPSYRYEVTLEGKGSIAESLGITDITGSGGASFKYVIKGAWIAPDKAQLELDFAGQALKQTIIGREQWITVEGLTTGPLPAEGEATELSLAAAFIDQQTITSTLEDFDCSRTEEVNGVRALRCEGDLDDFKRAESQFGSIFADTTVSEVTSFKSVVWIAEEGGYPVKAETEMGGKTADGKDFSLALTMNVTDIGQVTEIKP